MSPKRPPRAEATPPKPFASRDSPEPPRTAGASTSSPDKEPSVCPPGRAIFAVVVPPKELEPEDKRYALPRRAFPRGDATARHARVAPRLRARASRFPVRAANAAFKPATFGCRLSWFSCSFARAAFPPRHWRFPR